MCLCSYSRISFPFSIKSKSQSVNNIYKNPFFSFSFSYLALMATPHSSVVQGEAAESDDDEANTNYSVTIVDGEAPESDEEIASFSNLPSVNQMGVRFKPNYSPHTSPLRIRSVEESLLHKKLCERNLSLWNSLNAFIQSTVSSTSKRLIATDQLLVQSQVTLQTVSRTIKKVNESTAEITDKFKAIVGGNFIPEITLS